MSEQVAIDCLQFAEKSRQTNGTISPSICERLADLLFNGLGEIHYRLVGSVNAEGKPQLALTLEARLNLVCQRCLMPLLQVIEATTLFEIVPGEDAIPPEERDDIEYLASDRPLLVEALVEEELLLQLPLAPAHAQCQMVADGVAGNLARPFDVLRSLKDKQ